MDYSFNDSSFDESPMDYSFSTDDPNFLYNDPMYSNNHLNFSNPFEFDVDDYLHFTGTNSYEPNYPAPELASFNSFDPSGAAPHLNYEQYDGVDDIMDNGHYDPLLGDYQPSSDADLQTIGDPWMYDATVVPADIQIQHSEVEQPMPTMNESTMLQSAPALFNDTNELQQGVAPLALVSVPGPVFEPPVLGSNAGANVAPVAAMPIPMSPPQPFRIPGRVNTPPLPEGETADQLHKMQQQIKELKQQLKIQRSVCADARRHYQEADKEKKDALARLAEVEAKHREGRAAALASAEATVAHLKGST